MIEEAQKRGAAKEKQGAHQHQVKQRKQVGPQEGETLGGRVNPQMQHRGAHRQGHQGYPELPAWRFHGESLKFDAVPQQEDQDDGRGVKDEPARAGIEDMGQPAVHVHPLSQTAARRPAA